MNEERRPLRSVALEHAGLLVSGGFAFVVVYRLLSLARWDTPTAAAILQHAGSVNVLLGVVLTAAPPIVTLVLWLLGGLLFYRWARDRKWPGFIWYGLVTLMTMLIGLTIATGPQLILMLLVWAGSAFIGLQDRSGDPDLARRQNQRLVAGTIGGLVVSSVIMSESSWLPRETIKAGERVPFTAYVLKAEPDVWVVLREDSREVEFIPADEDRTRTICEREGGWPGEAFWRRTIEMVGQQASADYPECPEP